MRLDKLFSCLPFIVYAYDAGFATTLATALIRFKRKEIVVLTCLRYN